MIVVVAAVKGGVGKTTSSVYLAALAGQRRPVTLIDVDPQAAAAEWIEQSEDPRLARVEVVEAPTDRLVAKALDRVDHDGVVVIDSPPSNERLLAKLIDRATVVVIPTRVGGIEMPRVHAMLEMVGDIPHGLVVTAARTVTRDYHEALESWAQEKVPVWGSIPERVGIAAGPAAPLHPDALDAYRKVWRRVQSAARGR